MLLILRDPWLLSQTLMQLLYLLPPAAMLWQSYAHKGGAPVVLIPMLVMAAGRGFCSPMRCPSIFAKMLGSTAKRSTANNATYSS